MATQSYVLDINDLPMEGFSPADAAVQVESLSTGQVPAARSCGGCGLCQDQFDGISG